MKAIIMAGGMGTRLRPLTCDTPKPMVELFDKPVMAHIVSLLHRCGFDSICATIGFKSKQIQDYFADSLQFSLEETPLGTAGGVANCRDFIGGGDFLVISGDAVCDFDLRKAVEFHTRNQAAVTVVTYRHPDPRQYGIVQTDPNGRITGFIEKPMWKQVFTDRINTGIYVISPKVLDYVPKGESFDFSKDLFPLLLDYGIPMYACPLDGYWCDIGSCSDLLRCAKDALNRKLKLDIPGLENAPGLWVNSDIPRGARTISPCYIGKNVTIEPGCVIGPDSIIGTGSHISARARVHGSMVCGAEIQPDTLLENCIVLKDSVVQRGAHIMDQAVVGRGVTVGHGSWVQPNVRLWNETQIPPDTTQQISLTGNLSPAQIIDGRGRIAGQLNEDLRPEILITLGSAIANMGKAALSCDGSSNARLAMDLIGCGIRAANGYAVTHDSQFITQAALAAIFYRFPLSVFVEGNGFNVCINLLGADGAPLSPLQRRHIADSVRRWDCTLQESAGTLTDIRGIPQLCISAARRWEIKPGSYTAAVSGSSHTAGYAKRLLAQIGVDIVEPKSAVDTYTVEPDGTLSHITTVSGRDVSADRIWLIVSHCLLSDGRECIRIPNHVPMAVDTMAQGIGAYTDRCDGGALPLPLRDGIMATACIINHLVVNGITLDKLLDCIPESHCVTAHVPLKNGRANAMASLALDRDENGGVYRSGRGIVQVRPSSVGTALRIYVESGSMEAAEELCADFQARIHRADAGADE